MQSYLATLVLFFSVFSSTLEAARVGLLIMATGKYIEYVNPLIKSAEKYFCKGHEVTYFVFTDGAYQEKSGVRVIHQPRLGWPFDTMMRFQVYYDNRVQFADQDYLYACDADMLFVGKVGGEIFSYRVATMHPGFYNKKRQDCPYETDPRSLACIYPHEGKAYYAGGFYGGEASVVVKMAQINAENILSDLSQGIIAAWHDESHLNRYFINFPPTRVLTPSYCYPESWELPFEKKLLALDKNHTEMRKEAEAHD